MAHPEVERRMLLNGVMRAALDLGLLLERVANRWWLCSLQTVRDVRNRHSQAGFRRRGQSRRGEGGAYPVACVRRALFLAITGLGLMVVFDEDAGTGASTAGVTSCSASVGASAAAW